jgi:hypothetical protein
MIQQIRLLKWLRFLETPESSNQSYPKQDVAIQIAENKMDKVSSLANLVYKQKFKHNTIFIMKQYHFLLNRLHLLKFQEKFRWRIWQLIT